MWPSLATRLLLERPSAVTLAKRNTHVLKRMFPMAVTKMGRARVLEEQDFIYEPVEMPEKAPIEIVLTKDVAGVGMVGETISVEPFAAYSDFLLPKLAVYASSPEAKSIVRKKEDVKQSSIYSKIIANYMVEHPVAILLSSKTKWTLERWHVKMSLRKVGLIAQEDCITLPEKEISGPDDEVLNKDFIVKLTLNKSEVYSVRCRIYLSDADESKFANVQELLYTESSPLFPEQAEEINAILTAERDLKQRKELFAVKS